MISLSIFLQIICSQTNDVLQSPSFEDVELSTVLAILDQECLHIDSEMDLFCALVRYAEKHGHGKAICKCFPIEFPIFPFFRLYLVISHEFNLQPKKRKTK